MTQWESGLLITSKKFPSYYLKLPLTGKKHRITFASSQWPFTSLICMQPSELRPILNSIRCRINKSIIYKTPSFFGFRNFWLKNSDVTACWSGLGNGYFVILREHPLRNSNQQPNLPWKRKPKDLKLGPVWNLWTVWCIILQTSSVKFDLNISVFQLLRKSMQLNSFMTEAVIIKKSVQSKSMDWFL